MKYNFIFLPKNINFMIVKKDNNVYLYLYNNTLFCSIYINLFTIYFKKSLNLISLLEINSNITKYLNYFLFNWEFFLIKKISFTGKSFKIKKKGKCVFFFFNKSHLSVLFYFNIIVKKIYKNKILIFYKKSSKALSDITSIKNLSIFTKRGLRNSRQLVYKKRGKDPSKT